MDDLGLVKTVDGFGECIVIAVSNIAYRRFDACLRQALRVFDRDVLAAPVAMVLPRVSWYASSRKYLLADPVIPKRPPGLVHAC